MLIEDILPPKEICSSTLKNEKGGIVGVNHPVLLFRLVSAVASKDIAGLILNTPREYDVLIF